MNKMIVKKSHIFFTLLFFAVMTLLFSVDFTKAKYSTIVDVCTIKLDFSKEEESIDIKEDNETSNKIDSPDDKTLQNIDDENKEDISSTPNEQTPALESVIEKTTDE